MSKISVCNNKTSMWYIYSNSFIGGRDSTPVRGVPYEPVVLLRVSAELSLS